VGDQVHRAEVADRDLGVGGVQRDLGAQVGAVHDADVLLRRTHVAGSLNVIQGCPVSNSIDSILRHSSCTAGTFLNSLSSPGGLLLVADVGLLEGLAVLVVQVGAVGRREQRPLAVLHDPLHEQVGNPVGGVHVVRAAAVVAGVLAQLEELLDVEVPGLQVGADRALALAALVDRHRGVVDDLQERHHALALAVGALDVRAQRAHRRPVVAQAAGVLGSSAFSLMAS
jgi:hypothetical protein